MTLQSVSPDQITQVIQPDGRLTIDGVLLLQRIIEDLRAIDARLTAAEADIADHETRITALEP